MQDGVCVECSRAVPNESAAIITAVVLTLAGAMAAGWLWHKMRHLSDMERQAFVAIAKSMWQPVRIMIT